MLADSEKISFAEWLIELNACATGVGYRGEPIVRITGQLCWHSDYEGGLSPFQALEMAACDGAEFGWDFIFD